MGYQKPKKDHPWYNGFNRTPVKEVEDKHKKPVKILIREFASAWDTMEVYTYSYGKEGKYKLSELSQSKQAAWLVGMLRRSYEQIKI